jgi:hypothetical protein
MIWKTRRCVVYLERGEGFVDLISVESFRDLEMKGRTA